MKREWFWATAITVAALSAACNGMTDATGLSPTAPSAAGPTNLTAEQTASLAATCAFGSGTAVLNSGPPPGGAPGTPGTSPTTGTSPGVGPSGPPPAGTYIALGGTIESQTGSCPAVTFTVSGKTVRTTDTTSFGTGTCVALKVGDQIGAMGIAQADGSVVASCVAGM